MGVERAEGGISRLRAELFKRQVAADHLGPQPVLGALVHHDVEHATAQIALAAQRPQERDERSRVAAGRCDDRAVGQGRLAKAAQAASSTARSRCTFVWLLVVVWMRILASSGVTQAIASVSSAPKAPVSSSERISQ